MPEESESESESEEDEEVSGTRSSSWHMRLKRSSFSLCGDGDGTAGPSAEAKGGFGFCKETGGGCSRGRRALSRLPAPEESAGDEQPETVLSSSWGSAPERCEASAACPSGP